MNNITKKLENQEFFIKKLNVFAWIIIYPLFFLFMAFVGCRGSGKETILKYVHPVDCETNRMILSQTWECHFSDSINFSITLSESGQGAFTLLGPNHGEQRFEWASIQCGEFSYIPIGSDRVSGFAVYDLNDSGFNLELQSETINFLNKKESQKIGCQKTKEKKI